MAIIIYADFGCPYCYLASLRADQLLWSGIAEIDWRAVTDRRDPPDDSRGRKDGRDDRDRDLARSRRSPGRASRVRIHWPAR